MKPHSTSEDLKARYGISDPTLHRWEKSGKIPRSFKLGHRKLWVTEQLDEHDAQLIREAVKSRTDLETAGADAILDDDPRDRIAKRA